MFRRLVSLTVVALLLAGPARAQLVVIDPGNLVQAILIADRTLQEYTTLIQQYQTILRMAQGLGPLVPYRMPPIGITAHDPSRWLYGAPWLQGLNTGDARGTLYEQTARPLERPNGVLDPLPPSAQQAIEDAYATIEITDSIAEIAGHQVALVRGYSGTLQQATQTVRERRAEHAAGVPRHDGRPGQSGGRGTVGAPAGHGHQPVALTRPGATPRAQQADARHRSRHDEHAAPGPARWPHGGRESDPGHRRCPAHVASTVRRDRR